MVLKRLLKKANIKYVLLVFIIFMFIFLLILKVYKAKTNNEIYINDNISRNNKIMTINANNYTSILNTVYENINDYIGVKIKFSGFVYRVDDFDQNQFVLGRQMIISTDYRAVVVGFLCELNDAIKYKDGEWIEIEGIIEKGNYNGEIPIIKITKIKEISTPNDEYVYPPKYDYIPVFKML